MQYGKSAHLKGPHSTLPLFRSVTTMAENSIFPIFDSGVGYGIIVGLGKQVVTCTLAHLILMMLVLQAGFSPLS